ncbi:MAG TPA: DUF1778 domain-containing protein [Rhizomicrobium sp.]|nr:DUF1778 domain-containing protein [Rhizomicrobium sp.]
MAMAAVKPRPKTTRPAQDATINVRVSTMTRDLIDNAANILGKTRTDFIVESARKHAINVLLDQRFFPLGTVEYDAFVAALDAPPAPNERLRKLMLSKSPWQK